MKNITELYFNPVNMLKTVLFGFMTNGYMSLRELEDNCKVNIRFMYLMDNEHPFYRTFGYFINEVLSDSIEEIFYDINHKILEEEKVDLNHIYIDGTKLEANANKYSWVWKKATEKSRYRLFEKITLLIDEINQTLTYSGIKLQSNVEYIPEELREMALAYATKLDEYIAVIDVNQYRSDMDSFIPLMNKFKESYGFYPEYPTADAGYGSYNNYLFCEQTAT